MLPQTEFFLTILLIVLALLVVTYEMHKGRQRKDDWLE